MCEETRNRPPGAAAKMKNAGEKAEQSGNKSYTADGRQGCVAKDNEMITIKLLGDKDAPIRNQQCQVTDSEKNKHNGKTDANGTLVIEGLPKGECLVSFTALDRDAWGIDGNEDSGKRNDATAKTHSVVQGEDIDSIAYEYGFLPDTIWDLEANEGLREKRKNPAVLKEGDEVKIPKKVPREEPAQPGSEPHTFRRKGAMAELRIRFTDDDGPRANVPYIFKIVTRCGAKIADVSAQTDKDSLLTEVVPPNTTEGEIVLNPGEDEEYVPFRLNYINPVDDGFQGVQSMLNNMGYYCGDEDDDLGELTIAAVREFQEEQMNLEEDRLLPETATKIDKDTLKAIEKAYTE